MYNMTTIRIPLHLVLSSISESEASGSSTLVSPVQHRRRANHGLPAKHPHRRRKVSAPPELQSHFGVSPHTHYAHAHTHAHNIQGHGGANPDHADTSANSEYILNFPGHKHLSGTFHSGSDSGVPSEYSSWAAPVSGTIHREGSAPSELPSGSANDLANQRQPIDPQEVTFYQSDSDCESLDGLQSPQRQRKPGGGRGMSNQGYVNTEPAPVVLPVGSPPPFNRIPTEPSMNSPPPSISGMPMGHSRRHSMVLQLNLQGAPPPVHSMPHSTRGRSVSMVSLNANQPMPNMYPSLHDTQSMYSEVGYGQHVGFSGGHHMESQGSLSGGGMKIVDSQQTLVAGHNEHVSNHPDMLDPDAPQPTEEGEKKSRFQLTLSKNMSIMYAVFLVSLGIVIYLADTFSGHDSAIAEGFNVYLIVAQLVWLFYVHVDVRRYVNLISRALDEAKTKQVNKDEQVQLEPTGDGQYQLRINVPEAPRTIPQHYGFTSGRHGGSLYLKIGATVFCLGYLIHTGLNLGQKILYLAEDDPLFDNCTCTTDVVMSVLQPVYAFYQLFFIFKYSNLIINRRLVLSRFGIMHCIASSLCFWIYTILQETLQAIFLKKLSEKSNAEASAAAKLVTPGDEDDSDEMDEDDLSNFTGRKISAASATTWSINYGCEKDTHLSSMINTTTPYLYPFSIEFSILMVGLWILLWENIGKFERHTHIPSVEVTYEEDNSKSLTSNLIIYVDCHASNRGLFAGLLMTVATIISIILFFIFSTSEDTKQLGSYVNGISEVVLLSCMLITAFIAYNSIRILDIIKDKLSSVDDILLYVSLPCIFLYAFLSMVPAIKNGEVLLATVSIIQVCQVILQTALICDGLRRCSNSQRLQNKKPGREFLTYLVVANVAMWLLQTFEIKSEEGNSALYKFYGKELWTLLSHLTLPLALFYRFHSSVCLADMWKASYEAEEGH
ncbi:proton channel OtopLc isoform X3 [Procambarus clarkii]|uniref:proton channel OtopLc isoform X3 n=1 Tax=Procambarus clarkii TaxID=6728 RepID=UPI001E670637|nr:proton channel OtopLc-like isoform X2 [Procambarus clarkii]